MKGGALAAFSSIILAGCGPARTQPGTAAGGDPGAPPLVVGPIASTVPHEEECGEPYKPAPAWSGPKPLLPVVPELPDLPATIGDAFTVFGAAHALRSRHASEALGRADVSIVGFIVDTNLGRAPRCAIHRTGIADPPGCDAESPMFTIADEKSAPPTGDGTRIRVAGWASNFANVHEASLAYAKSTTRPSSLYSDPIWAVEVPWPLPAVGAKVKVTGRYGFLFSKSSRGVVHDPKNGMMTAAKVEYLEPAPQPAKLGP